MNNMLMSFDRIIDIYCENYTKSISSLYIVGESGMFNVEVFGKYTGCAKSRYTVIIFVVTLMDDISST